MFVQSTHIEVNKEVVTLLKAVSLKDSWRRVNEPAFKIVKNGWTDTVEQNGRLRIPLPTPAHAAC